MEENSATVNQRVSILRVGTKSMATPRPTSRRAPTAQTALCARPRSTDPTPPRRKNVVTVRRGPQESGQQPRGNLHEGVGVEVRRGQQAHEARARAQVGHEVQGHHGRAEPVEKDQEVTRSQESEHQPAVAGTGPARAMRSHTVSSVPLS